MYDRILVPVDGSKFSEEILPHAAGLAGMDGTALAIMRVVDREGAKAEAEAHVRALAERYGARALCFVAHGDIADAIAGEAHRVPRTLIAMTSHGRSGLMEAMLGSIALRIVRRGDAALVYRPGSGPHPRGPVKVSRVVLPLDGTKDSEAIAPQAVELARWLDAELMVIGVIDPLAQEDAAGVVPGDLMESSHVRSRAEDYARQGARVSWDVLHGEPVEAIADFINRHDDVILAMATHGRQALETLFLGSVTAGCLRKAGVPVLMRRP